MPTIHVKVDPYVTCEITEYKDYIFIYNLKNAIVYNKFTIRNIGEKTITSVAVNLPYSCESVKNVKTNTEESPSTEEFFADYCSIKVNLEIKAKKERSLEIVFNSKMDVKKSSEGWTIPFHYYNMNFLRKYKKELNLEEVPVILKEGLELAVICPKSIIFGNQVYPPKMDDLKMCEGVKEALVKIKEYFEKESEFKKVIKTKWERVAIWDKSMLPDLKDNKILPDWDHRLIRVEYSKKDSVEIKGYTIKYIEMASIILSLMALIISIVVYLWR